MAKYSLNDIVKVYSEEYINSGDEEAQSVGSAIGVVTSVRDNSMYPYRVRFSHVRDLSNPEGVTKLFSESEITGTVDIFAYKLYLQKMEGKGPNTVEDSLMLSEKERDKFSEDRATLEEWLAQATGDDLHASVRSAVQGLLDVLPLRL